MVIEAIGSAIGIFQIHLNAVVCVAPRHEENDVLLIRLRIRDIPIGIPVATGIGKGTLSEGGDVVFVTSLPSLPTKGKGSQPFGKAGKGASDISCSATERMVSEDCALTAELMLSTHTVKIPRTATRIVISIILAMWLQ